MLTALQDTICAPATRTGGAIAIVRVSGSKALECVDAAVSLRRGRVCEAPGYSLRYGSVEGLDEVMVSVFRAPHSYTGEDSAEISCHASPYIVGELLGRLCEAGCRMAEPGEFTQRAFLNGKMDLAQAESVADLIASDSKAAHDLALRQLQGSYSSEFRELRDQLLRLSSLLELELDFSEEELEFADRSELESLTREALARVEKLRDSYRLGNAIKAGVPVAIVGEPNAGKSTLLNALLGEDRAIVSPVAGTTRDTVEEVMVLGGVKFRFIDTAGLRETSDPVERLGVERSLQKLRSASIVLSLVDCRQYREGMRWPGEEFCGDAVPGGGAMLLKVLSKCDLAEDAGDSCGAIRISAKTGLNCEDVLEAIVEKIPAPEGNPDAPLKALIFDSLYDSYKGVIVFCRIKEGTVKPGMNIRMMATGATANVVEVGYFGAGQFFPCDELSAGMVGYMTASIKNVRDTRVGDTITDRDNPCDQPLPGYKKVNPMVYCGLYPADGAKYPDLRDALEKLQLKKLYEEKFEKPLYAAGPSRMIENSVEVAKFFWGENEYIPTIDQMNAQFWNGEKKVLPCPIRFSIGAILFERQLWEKMGYFKVSKKGVAMGGDESQLCSYCCEYSKPIMVSDNVVVGHLGFGPQNAAMKEYYLGHKEKFMITGDLK